jgi:hypothetical protein
MHTEFGLRNLIMQIMEGELESDVTEFVVLL